MTDTVKYLLKWQGIEVNLPRNDGLTPFFLACSEGHVGLVSLLLADQRISVNKPADDGRTPFYEACRLGRMDVVSVLLGNKRVDINQANRKDITPLWLAASYGHLIVVQHLLVSGREIDVQRKPIFTSLSAAAQAKARGSMPTKHETDSDEDFQRCRANGSKIAVLIDSFEKDPSNTRSQLRKLLGMTVSDGALAADDLKGKSNAETKRGEDFLNAALMGDLSLVQRLSKDAAINLNFQGLNGQTALAVACVEGRAEVVKYLLGLPGVKVDPRDKQGATPLYLACQQAQVGIISLLLSDKRIDVNKADSVGMTPFFVACAHGHADVVSLLSTDKRVDVDQATVGGLTPLWAASSFGHLSVVMHLLASGRDIDTKKTPPFDNITAAELGRSLGARTYPDVGESDGDFQRKKANGPTIATWIDSFEKYPATTRSQIKKQLGIPASPLTTGGKDQMGGNVDFYLAAKGGDLQAVERLSVSPNVRVSWQNEEGATALAAACQEGQTAVIKYLLGLQGVMVNLPLKSGATPFFIACQLGHVDAVSVLLADQRVDINRPASDGATPFCIAWLGRHAKVVLLLLADSRVDINKANNSGATPFFVACEEGHVEGVSLLLADKRLDVNQSTSTNITPLWLASQNGHLPVVQLLLASGRELDTKRVSTYNNTTAARNARFMGSRIAKPVMESDVDFQRKKINCPKIADLIDSFEKYPAATRSQLRKQLGMPDYIPPPAGPPVNPQAGVPASLPATASLKKVAVEYNGTTRAVNVPLSSMDALAAALTAHLTITTRVSMEYYDADLDGFMALKDLRDLPATPIKIRVIAEALHWWRWSPNASWTKKGHDLNKYYSLLIKDGSNIAHPAAFQKFALAARSLGFQPELIHKIFAISNQKLLTNFENYRDTLHGKHRSNPELFKKSDWMTQPEAERRKRQLAGLNVEVSKWEWNDGASPAVLPMIQGTNENATWQICQNGFGVTATTDPGYYGQGVYFTSKLTYARQYAKDSGKGDGRVFLLSAVIPGNVFPITEHPLLPGGMPNPRGYLGKPCRPGYQSHHALVDEVAPEVEISPKNPGSGKIADELVVFEAAQAVPLFVFYIKF